MQGCVAKITNQVQVPTSGRNEEDVTQNDNPKECQGREDRKNNLVVEGYSSKAEHVRDEVLKVIISMTRLDAKKTDWRSTSRRASGQQNQR